MKPQNRNAPCVAVFPVADASEQVPWNLKKIFAMNCETPVASYGDVFCGGHWTLVEKSTRRTIISTPFDERAWTNFKSAIVQARDEIWRKNLVQLYGTLQKMEEDRVVQNGQRIHDEVGSPSAAVPPVGE